MNTSRVQNYVFSKAKGIIHKKGTLKMLNGVIFSDLDMEGTVYYRNFLDFVTFKFNEDYEQIL